MVDDAEDLEEPSAVLRGQSVLDYAAVFYLSSVTFRMESELHVYVPGKRDATARLVLSEGT